MSVRIERPLRAIADVALGRQRSPENDTGPHMVPYLRAANVKDGYLDLSDVKEMNFSPTEQRVFALRPGDVLVTEGAGSLAAVGASAVWNGEIDGTVCFQNTLLRLRPTGSTDRRFLAWWARHAYTSRLFASIAGGANIYHVGAERVRYLPVWSPSTSAQRAIADFLDVETERIDSLIKAEERLCDLALERLEAAIHASVLPGNLDTVPTGWLRRRNKTFLREVVDLSESGQEDLLTVSHLTGVSPRSEKDVYMFLAESTEGYKRVQPGDLVINTMWAWMGALAVSPHAGIVSPAYGVYRFTDSLADPWYFDALFRDRRYVMEMTRFSRGVWTSRLRLYPETFLAMTSVFPPPKQQRSIAATIRTWTDEYHRVRRLTARSIDLLRERRQALITAAVTGQLDIPAVA